MAHGGGLGSGGGLDNSGFKNRRPAVQEQMLSTTKDENVIQAEENLSQIIPALEHYEETVDDDGDPVDVKFKDADGKKKLITLNGRTKSMWKATDIKNIVEKSKDAVDKYEEKKQHDPKNFRGTTSKAVIFEKDGVVSKYKSISELCKATGMSKYQILKDSKPKKNGDSFYHEKLEGDLTFVNRKDL